jgi:hypothetical protein
LPFCQFAILSTCHFANLSFCQLFHFVNLQFCQFGILATCHFVTKPFCQLAIMSRHLLTCHFVLVILSTFHWSLWHFVNLWLCQLAILAFVNLPVHRLAFFSIWLRKELTYWAKGRNLAYLLRLRNSIKIIGHA